MPSDDDPFAILELPQSASESDIRTKYLQLVKQHPPETDPEKFRKIHQAYQTARDPLIQANRLLMPADKLPDWQELIEQQEKSPPLLRAVTLLALGNRPDSENHDGKSDE